MNKSALKAKVTKALRKGFKGSKKSINELVPEEFTAGKIYEAYVLALICQNFSMKEGFSLRLIGSKNIVLKSSPGPINHAYPRIAVMKGRNHIADIWTDVEFMSLSAASSGAAKLNKGQYHELDILVTVPNCQSRPRPNEVLFGVECKNTGYQKNLLREILGVRRELSLLRGSQPTIFSKWPRSEVPADPPSCLAVYSTDQSILSYQDPGSFFGIDFHHEPL